MGKYLVITQLQWVIPFGETNEQRKCRTRSLTAHDVWQWASGAFITPKAHASESNHWFYLVPNVKENKIITLFFYTTHQLHWNHLTFRFSLQHCLKDCERNIKLASKSSAHQHLISFALTSSHAGKSPSCLFEYMGIQDLKHAKICDFLPADKIFLCTLPG